MYKTVEDRKVSWIWVWIWRVQEIWVLFEIMIAYGVMSFPTVVQTYVINFLRVQSPLQLQVWSCSWSDLGGGSVFCISFCASPPVDTSSGSFKICLCCSGNFFSAFKGASYIGTVVLLQASQAEWLKDLVYVSPHRASRGGTRHMGWSFPFQTSCALRKFNFHVCERRGIQEGCPHPVSHQSGAIRRSKYFSNLLLSLHLGTDVTLTQVS